MSLDELRKLAEEAKATDFSHVSVPADMLLAILDRLAAAEAVVKAAERKAAATQALDTWLDGPENPDPADLFAAEHKAEAALAEALRAWREAGK